MGDFRWHKKIEAEKGLGFNRLVVEMTNREQWEWSLENTDGLQVAIQRELDQLRYLDEKVEKDRDAYLESLVRIAAMTRCFAATTELAHAKGVMR